MLSSAQLEAYERDGYLVVERFWSADVVLGLKAASDALLRSFEPPAAFSVFSTDEQERTSDEYFLSSGDKVRYFFEPGALDARGHLVVPKEVAVNKIGHALHELIPSFRAVSLECPRVSSIVRGLGINSPLVPQSMLICKHARIGGAVAPHVDGAFLYTRPQTCLGLWWPLEDCTLDNGCLWAVPGSHKRGGGAVARRFKRTADGSATEFDPADSSGAGLETEGAIPLVMPAGSLVIIHHNLVHFSNANTSERSRFAYSIHVVDSSAEWPKDNWLQRSTPFPAL
jgi:phytanoyl-CoA hydroxylase